MAQFDPTLAPPETVRSAVLERYRRRATACAGGGPDPGAIARAIGYRDEEIATVPDGANLGLGCGSPVGLVSLRPGETVLDLGSGAGFDAFLAAAAVGPAGRVIGVDMTPAMVAKASENARRAGAANVEFRHGTIEALPVDASTVDVVISNCVINLSPEKAQVFREAFRVLRPGGRLLISDVVLSVPLPAVVRTSIEAYLGCVAGAALRADYLRLLADAGFRDIAVVSEADATGMLESAASDPVAGEILAAVGGLEAARDLARGVARVAVAARKPAA